MGKLNRKVPEINSSSTADIAFLLLIFFLIVTSMDTDTGIQRRLPPPIPKDMPRENVKINERNILKVLINSDNQILVNSKETNIRQLRAKAEEFIENRRNASDLPEKIDVEVPFFGIYPVTKKHVISLQNHRDTEYQAYIEVQNELVAAYNNLRNRLSMQKFRKSFAELTDVQKEAIRMIYPLRISEAEPRDLGK